MSRFNPSDDDLRESLAWHSQITAELQRRVVEAQRYVRTHSGDPKLIAILGGDKAVLSALEGVDTARAFGQTGGGGPDHVVQGR